MREYDPCMGCQYYNKPYWSIVSPCDSCPRIYGTDSFVTTVTTQTYTNTNNCFNKTEHMEDFGKYSRKNMAIETCQISMKFKRFLIK